MSGLAVKYPGRRRGAAAFMEFSVMTGLQAAFFFGGTRELSQRNFVENRPPGLIVEDLDYPLVLGDYYAHFQGGRTYLRTTSLGGLEAATFMVVARTQDTLADGDHQPHFVGTGGGESGDGAENIQTAATTVTGNQFLLDSGSPVGTTSSITVDLTDEKWRIFSFRFSLATQKLRIVTEGSAQTDTDTPTGDTRHLSTSSPLCFGGGDGVTKLGHCDIYAGLVWNRYLTDQEVLDMEADLRTDAAYHTITL